MQLQNIVIHSPIYIYYYIFWLGGILQVAYDRSIYVLGCKEKQSKQNKTRHYNDVLYLIRGLVIDIIFSMQQITRPCLSKV
jgi:hypothetical protein